MRKLAILLPSAILALILVSWLTPSHSPTHRMVVSAPTLNPNTPEMHAPSPSQSLPACQEEDGAGMALCYWDAQTMGNGEGTSVISGDCAPDYVGGQQASNECVALYNTGQKGIDAVAECVETYNMTDADILKNEGWTFRNCIEAMW